MNRGVAQPDQLRVGNNSYSIYRLDALQPRWDVARLPYTLRILLENVLRNGTDEEVEAVAGWVAAAEPSREISFAPARVLLQDFTGVPCVVDLAAMRNAMEDQGGDPGKINPLIPAELVIDHSVQVDEFASRLALERNVELEFHRNRERYAFLRWGQTAFDNFAAVPPNTGICHQVNLEFLARVVESRDGVAFPDTLVGTDSHTTMINGLGVLGWGVGGIEAEAAMLGESLSMLVPQVVGMQAHGRAAGRRDRDRPGADRYARSCARPASSASSSSTSAKGVSSLALADRATLGNMSPEYGATCGFFPVDDVTLQYLRLTGRSDERIALVEAYCKENMLWHLPEEHPTYSQVVELDLSEIEPSLAGPRRPQDRVPLANAKQAFIEALDTFGVPYTNGSQDKALADTFPASDPTQEQHPGGEPEPEPDREVEHSHVATMAKKTVPVNGEDYSLEHGSVVICAITSCTNTSNPSVMIGAGLLAKKAVEKGLKRKPWVKSSLAPGSKVVTEYYARSGLDTYLDELGFNLVGYGCTTCIGNSGPLPENIAEAVAEGELIVCAVLSGNRNFEARIHRRRESELPRFAAARRRVRARGKDGHRPAQRAARRRRRRAGVPARHLADGAEVDETISTSIDGEMFRRRTATCTPATSAGRRWRFPPGISTHWQDDSTYIRRPPYFDGMQAEPGTVEDIAGARVLVMLGDSVTTDHISPAGAIRPTRLPGSI